MQLVQIALFAFVAVSSAVPATTPTSTTAAIQNPFYNVPVCARNCATSLPSTCAGKPDCVCSNQAWMWAVECCVANSCSAADQVTTFQFANQLCSYVNVKITSPPSCTAQKGLASSTATTNVKATSTSTAPTGNPTSVSGYVPKGCYSESTSGSGLRALNSSDYIDPIGMTIESCVSYCKGKGLSIAGLEYSQECWCGNAIENGGAKLPDNTGCNLPCKGNSGEICGGLMKLSVYQKS